MAREMQLGCPQISAEDSQCRSDGCDGGGSGGDGCSRADRAGDRRVALSAQHSERLREISGMVFWCQCMQPRRDRHAPEALALRLLLLFWTCRCNRLFCEIFALCILDRTAVWCCLEVLVGRCSTGLFDARKRLKELYGSFEFHARGMMGKSYRHTQRALLAADACSMH